MGLTASDKGSGGDFDIIEEGMHKAICYGIYDLGTQFNATFGKKQHKVLINFELPDERINVEKDGEEQNLPRAISNFYTLSLHKKSNLRNHLETWRGKSFTDEELKAFDITKLLGVNCTLQVLHKKTDEKTYANIVGITPRMRDVKSSKPENTPRYFSFEDHTTLPADTPEWIEKIIMEADEWGKAKPMPTNDNKPPPIDDDDDLPF